MKKLLFVIEQLTGGGAERVTAALANELCMDKEYEIHIASYVRDEEKDYPVSDEVKWHVLPQMEQGRLGAIKARMDFLKNTVKEVKPYCVLSLGTPRIAVLLAFAMIGCKIPLILSERNDPANFPVSRVWRKLRDISYYLADGVVFQTGEARDYFTVSVRSKGVVISNPITDNLPPRFEGERDKRIVNCCRLVPQKNLNLLFDAFSDVLKEFPEYTLHIYGDGPDRQVLEQRIREMNLENDIFLPGYSNEIHTDILEASMFVSSSDYEGISNSMLEAIALGVPTVCTDCPVGGARETIRHGENGLLVPVRNRSALADAMKKILADKELMNQISLAGCDLREEISVQIITKRWMAFTEKIVKEKTEKNNCDRYRKNRKRR